MFIITTIILYRDTAMPEKHEVKDERALMKGVAGGDWAACETLVKRYTNVIYRFLVRSLGSTADAEDILQETFLRAFRHANSFDPHYSISTWLFTIARRLAINASQARSRRIHLFTEHPQHTGDDEREPEIYTDVAETGPTPEEQLSKKELGARLQEAIARLPERQRSALLLTYYEGLSYQEVSRVVGTSLSSVESAIYRAKQTLAKMLDK